jgi:hypothetical protein
MEMGLRSGMYRGWAGLIYHMIFVSITHGTILIEFKE